jgi:hypothetical protein
MRWKLWRRRLSVSAPRMIVRSHLPWPLRWAVLALVLGFSAALALWAFEFGREIAGLDRSSKSELQALRSEAAQLRAQQQQAQAAADTVQSLLTSERAAQASLAQQLKQAQSEARELREDLGFFERLLPADQNAALQLRGLQAELLAPGQARFQVLVMQGDRAAPEFAGRIEFSLSGQLEGRPWTYAVPAATQALRLRGYQRLAGVLEYPAGAQPRQLQVRVIDAAGTARITQSARL